MCYTRRQTVYLLRTSAGIPDVGDGVVDQLQCREQEVFVEVFPGEDLRGRFTNVQEPQAIPVAPPLSQI